MRSAFALLCYRTALAVAAVSVRVMIMRSQTIANQQRPG